jgi:uncharacterized membrane protein
VSFNLRPTTRIEAYSDSIFAIVLTLLVLDLHAPNVPVGAPSSVFLSALYPVLFNFIGFAASFLVVAIYLINHHNFFSTISETDDHFLWYNNLLLFFICIIPFPTSFISTHPTDAIPVALYGLNLFFASIAFWLMTRHADYNKLYKTHLQGEYSRMRVYRNIPALLLYGCSIPLAFIDPLFSLLIFVIVPLIYFLPSRFSEFVMYVIKRKSKKKNK